MEDELHRHGLSLVLNISRLWRVLTRGLGKRLHRSGLNMPQFFALAQLEKLGETTMGDLTEELGTTMGAVTNIIDKLVHSGYVDRRRNTEDRRVVNVALTSAGRDVVTEVHTWGAGQLARFLERMTPQESRSFVETFVDLVDYTEEDFASLRYTDD